MKLVVYEWNAWEAFLLKYTFPDAIVIHGTLFESAYDILARVPNDCTHFIFQVNISVRHSSPIHRELVISEIKKRGIVVVNQYCSDITKRSLQNFLEENGLNNVKVDFNGVVDFPVFVKTNENAGAEFERTLSDEQRFQLGIPRPSMNISSAKGYYVEMASVVMTSHIQDPGIVCERYIENQAGDFVRAYVAGELVIIVFARSGALIKKISGHDTDRNIVTTRQDLIQTWKDIPKSLADTIRLFLDKSRIDYAAIDLVTDGMEYYVVDVNDTPWVGRHSPDMDFLELLAAGISDIAPGER